MLSGQMARQTGDGEHSVFLPWTVKKMKKVISTEAEF